MNLIIPAALERKLNAYVQAVDVEIAGMGSIEMREDGNLWVEDITIYDQEVTGSTADLSTQALAHFQTDLVKRGISPKKWCLWWHSHVNMGAYFSTTDTGTIATSDEFDHIVSLVVNKRRERKARLDMHRPFRLSIADLKIEIAPEVNQQTIALDERIWALIEEAKALEAQKNEIEQGEPEGIKEEVAEKVKIKTYPIVKRRARYGGHQHNRRNDLTGPLDESWSKKRKKDGTVSTIGEIISSRLDPDEIELIIENTLTMIRAHEANGNGDTVECEELRADLETYKKYQEEIEKADNEEDLFWNGYAWVDGKEMGYIAYDDEDHNVYQDDMGLPPLPGRYKYGFNRGGKDDERE